MNKQLSYHTKPRRRLHRCALSSAVNGKTKKNKTLFSPTSYNSLVSGLYIPGGYMATFQRTEGQTPRHLSPRSCVARAKLNTEIYHEPPMLPRTTIYRAPHPAPPSPAACALPRCKSSKQLLRPYGENRTQGERQRRDGVGRGAGKTTSRARLDPSFPGLGA